MMVLAVSATALVRNSAASSSTTPQAAHNLKRQRVRILFLLTPIFPAETVRAYAMELATPQALFAKEEVLSVHKCECGKSFAHGPAFYKKAMLCVAHGLEHGTPDESPEVELYQLFKEQRSTDKNMSELRMFKRVKERWLVVMMRKIIREHFGDEPADKFKDS
ncbi:MAG: hypothetical protein SGPRY_009312 [Prymnesium sp.]